MFAFIKYALWIDLRRRSSLALGLSMFVIAVSIGLCSILFGLVQAISASLEAEMVESGAANVMEGRCPTRQRISKTVGGHHGNG